MEACTLQVYALQYVTTRLDEVEQTLQTVGRDGLLEHYRETLQRDKSSIEELMRKDCS